MEYLTVKGTTVPVIGLGTARLLGDDCLAGVEHALAIGYRVVDTAQRYGNEEEVGTAIARSSVPRDDIFLTTKVGHHWQAAEVHSTTRESLTRLKTDYVDLLLIHWPSPDVPVSETLGAMMELQAEGLARAIGVSNFPPSLYRQAIELAPIITNQVEYHPYLSQDELLAISWDNGLMLTAFSPLGRGIVLDNPTLTGIAEGHGKGVDQVVLRWLTQQPSVSTNPKSAHAERRERNIDIFDFTLSDEEMALIHAIDREQRVIDPPFAPDWERQRR